MSKVTFEYGKEVGETSDPGGGCTRWSEVLRTEPWLSYLRNSGKAIVAGVSKPWQRREQMTSDRQQWLEPAGPGRPM